RRAAKDRPADPSAREPDVDLAVDVVPLLGRAQTRHKTLEPFGMFRRVLEPREEVEGLAQIACMVQPPRDRRQVLEPDGDVVRSLLDDPPPLVLRKRPPVRRLPDRDERRARRLGTSEARL